MDVSDRGRVKSILGPADEYEYGAGPGTQNVRTIKTLENVKKTEAGSGQEQFTAVTPGGLPGKVPSQLAELVAGGFPAFQVNRAGEILWSCNATGGVLQRLGVIGEKPGDTRIKSEWNSRLWDNKWGNGTEQQLRLIGPRYDCGCTGVAVRSALAPEMLSVCLMPLGSIGIGIDPLWGQILAGVSTSA